MTPDYFRHVNTHLTPMAIIVVVPGVFLAGVSRGRLLLSLALLAYSVLFNYLSLRWVDQPVQRIAKLRVASNYLVTIVLMWALYTAWPPVWLLLLLMAVGPALYQSRRDAALTAVAVATFLLVMHGLLGEWSALGWGEAAVNASAIVVLSLFVNATPGLRRPA